MNVQMRLARNPRVPNAADYQTLVDPAPGFHGYTPIHKMRDDNLYPLARLPQAFSRTMSSA